MQDFLYGLAFVAPGDQKPVTVGVPTELIRGDVYYWGSLMAAALMVGLPVAILYNFFLDRFIQGITGGGREERASGAAPSARPAAPNNPWTEINFVPHLEPVQRSRGAPSK